jgi:hypothetical protein
MIFQKKFTCKDKNVLIFWKILIPVFCQGYLRAMHKNTADSLVYASLTYTSLVKLSYLCEFFPVPSIAYTGELTVFKSI